MVRFIASLAIVAGVALLVFAEATTPKANLRGVARPLSSRPEGTKIIGRLSERARL
jgi:hypothetical protein